MQATIRVILAGLLAGVVAACGVTSPSDLKTDTWSDSVAPGSASGQFIFNNGKTGEVIVKITALSPDTGASLTFQYGAPATLNNQVGCAFQPFPSILGLNRGTLDTQLPAGDYCVQMSDPAGALPRTQTFTATIQHQ